MLRCACWRTVINTGRHLQKDDFSLIDGGVSPLVCLVHAFSGPGVWRSRALLPRPLTRIFAVDLARA